MLIDELQSSKSIVARHLHKLGKRLKRGQTISLKCKKIGEFLTASSYFSHGVLQQILIFDEKWVVYDNPKPKNQWLSLYQPGIPLCASGECATA